jgi:hypothetical protein
MFVGKCTVKTQCEPVNIFTIPVIRTEFNCIIIIIILIPFEFNWIILIFRLFYLLISS